MASDRFIYFDAERPTNEQVGWVIEDYFGKAAVSIEWSERTSRWEVLLPGNKSVACRRVAPETVWAQCANELSTEERFIEVFFTERGADEQLSVTTRLADEYTDTVADGLATLLARYWGGKVQRG